MNKKHTAYKVVPTTKDGDYAADTVTDKSEAIELAKQLFEEFSPECDDTLTVYVWLNDGLGSYDASIDPVFYINNTGEYAS